MSDTMATTTIKVTKPEKEFARIRRRKISELASISERLGRTDRHRVQRLVSEVDHGGSDWAPSPKDGQWVDKTYQHHFAKPAPDGYRNVLQERASQEWVMNNLTETNRRRLRSILDTPVEKWTQEQIDWVEKVETEAEMKNDGDE